jgi:hypothetical protein
MEFSFTLLLDGLNINDQESLDKIFEAGCDDATFGERDGVVIAMFDRDAETFVSALGSAIQSLESAIEGIQVLRVEPEELVTVSEIANRTNRSREGVRLLFEGSRGEGNFPRPAAWLSDRTRLFHWGEVYRWFASGPPCNNKIITEEWIAEVTSTVNAMLTERRFVGRFSTNEITTTLRTSTGRTPTDKRFNTENYFEWLKQVEAHTLAQPSLQH